MKFSSMIRRWPAAAFLNKPYTCNIKITQRCNLRCHFCGLWRMRDRAEMSVHDYSHIAQLLYNIGVARIVITGGEPLIREDLEEIVSCFAHKKFSITLLTNGTLLPPDRLANLIKAGVDDIGISLDTLHSKTFDEICGANNQLETVIGTIKNARSLVRKGYVQVLTTVSSRNINEIPQIADFVTRELDCWSMINPINISRSPNSILTAANSSEIFPLPPEKVDYAYDALEKMKRSGEAILVSSKFLKESRSYLKTGNSKWNCHAGISYFTIFSDGAIAPCSDTSIVANINSIDEDYFRSSEYQIACRKQRAACGGCIFSCWREASYVLHSPEVWPERCVDFIKSLMRKG